MKCLGCGASILDKAASCEYCGKKSATEIEQKFGASGEKKDTEFLGSNQHPPPQTPSKDSDLGTSSQNELAYLDGVSDFYKSAFKIFDEKSSGLQAKFGWAPFLFGPLWYFYKGLWGKGLIYLAIALSTVGTLALLPWLYGSIFGVYDYYLLKKFNKQFW